MPTCEYECDECGYRFERFQSISDKRIERCPGVDPNGRALSEETQEA